MRLFLSVELSNLFKSSRKSFFYTYKDVSNKTGLTELTILRIEQKRAKFLNIKSAVALFSLYRDVEKVKLYLDKHPEINHILKVKNIPFYFQEVDKYFDKCNEIINNIPLVNNNFKYKKEFMDSLNNFKGQSITILLKSKDEINKILQKS